MGYSGVYAAGDSNAFRDASGYDLQVTGATAEFESQTEESLGGAYDISIDSAGGVTMALVGDASSLNGSQQTLAGSLQLAIGHSKTIQIEAQVDAKNYTPWASQLEATG